VTASADAASSIDREARVAWQGGLSEGAGRLETPSGVGDGAGLSWGARTGPAPGTSPEELIAAAHAGCYSMALSHVLEQHGTMPEHLDVRARCLAEEDDGLVITAVVLEVVGVVPGLDGAEFSRLAEEAERRCPVSNALRGNVEIRVDALLAA